MCCHGLCPPKPGTILTLVLTCIVLHQMAGDGSLHLKENPAMTKLQISETNPFPLTSLKGLLLLAPLSEQEPDPEPLKQALWLSDSSGTGLVCCWFTVDISHAAWSSLCASTPPPSDVSLGVMISSGQKRALVKKFAKLKRSSNSYLKEYFLPQ